MSYNVHDNHELLDEAEQDTQNYSNEFGAIADRSLNNSDTLRKPNSIILLLFIPQEKSAMRIQIKTDKNYKDKFLTPKYTGTVWT